MPINKVTRCDIDPRNDHLSWLWVVPRIMDVDDVIRYGYVINFMMSYVMAR